MSGSRAPLAKPISVRIPDAARLTGLSRSRLYVLIASGEIEVVKVGRSTLVPYQVLEAFIESHRKDVKAPLLKEDRAAGD